MLEISWIPSVETNWRRFDWLSSKEQVENRKLIVRRISMKNEELTPGLFTKRDGPKPKKHCSKSLRVRW